MTAGSIWEGPVSVRFFREKETCRFIERDLVWFTIGSGSYEAERSHYVICKL